jgi:hypothetical protein
MASHKTVLDAGTLFMTLLCIWENIKFRAFSPISDWICLRHRVASRSLNVLHTCVMNLVDGISNRVVLATQGRTESLYYHKSVYDFPWDHCHHTQFAPTWLAQVLESNSLLCWSFYVLYATLLLLCDAILVSGFSAVLELMTTYWLLLW